MYTWIYKKKKGTDIQFMAYEITGHNQRLFS